LFLRAGNSERFEMPRYFFHVRDGADLSRDFEGQELPDLAAARHEAVSAVRELVGERLLHGGAIDGRTIEIANERDDVLAAVNASDVIFCEGQFRRYDDDVTKSAPVAMPISPKPSAQ
jgi:hypothetical protein